MLRLLSDVSLTVFKLLIIWVSQDTKSRFALRIKFNKTHVQGFFSYVQYTHSPKMNIDAFIQQWHI